MCRTTKRSENGSTEYKAPTEATRNGETARRLEEEEYRGYVDSIGGGYAYDPELGVYSTRAVFQQTTPATTAPKSLVTVKVNGTDVEFICDSGTDITTISEKDWTRIKSESTTTGELKPTEVRLKPYGTTLAGVESLVPLAGQSVVALTAARGASIETLVVVARGAAANLLGEREATQLGILKIETAGASTARGLRTRVSEFLNFRDMKGSRPMPGLMEYSDHEEHEQLNNETKPKLRGGSKQRKKNRKPRPYPEQHKKIRKHRI